MGPGLRMGGRGSKVLFRGSKVLFRDSKVLFRGSKVLFRATQVSLDVSPTNIKLGLTTQLDVNCTVPYDPSGNVYVTLIMLYHSADTIEPNFTEVAGIDFISQLPTLYVNNSATINGHIYDNDTSYLSLQWEYPMLNETGRYRCDVSLLQEDNDLFSTVEATVTYEKPDNDDLFAELDKLRDFLQTAFRNVTDVWEKRLEDAMTAVFDVSALVDGRMYLLSKYSNMSLHQTEAMCRFQGGYLAEIDDQQELDSVKDFFNSLYISNDTYVVIGGSDEVKEGEWRYKQSGKTLTYIKWAPGHPSNATNNDLDCLAIDMGTDLTMVDTPCSRSNQNFRSRFLCEISHAPFVASN
ncbi:hypothetical protein Btru_003755 [Bulinus truncatus]|nr:hypothetical protein Btru_003755 [Bulinus truncatus]